jgi:hypothetical protein
VNEKIDVEKKVMNPDTCKSRYKGFKKLEEKWIEVIRRVRSACKEQRPPPGPCVSALRDFVEHPIFVLISTHFLVVYLVVIAVTGPQPDRADSPLDQKLLMGVSIAGIIVWGFELSLKFVSFGRKLFFLDAWRCLQFVCYLTLLADVCGSSGVAIVYIRAVELMSRFETIANFLVSGVLQLERGRDGVSIPTRSPYYYHAFAIPQVLNLLASLYKVRILTQQNPGRFISYWR